MITSFLIDDRLQVVDILSQKDGVIEGLISGQPVTLYWNEGAFGWQTEPVEEGMSCNVLIPNELGTAIAAHLDRSKQSLDDVVTAALALFLLQQGELEQVPKAVKRKYLETAIAA